MAGRFIDLLGTIFTKFQVGIGGPQLKNSSGTLEVRNAGDSAYAQMRMILAAITGDSIVLNEQALAAGSSWKFTVSRPGSGMTHDLTMVLPSGDPSVGQALTVAGFAGNVITLQWTTIASGSEKLVVDTTSLAFGSTSPVAMFTAPANAVHTLYQVIIDTAFNGTPSVSIGVSGTTAKYVPSNAVDLTASAGTVFEYAPGVAATGSTENIIATYSAGGASAGAARILAYYSIPA